MTSEQVGSGVPTSEGAGPNGVAAEEGATGAGTGAAPPEQRFRELYRRHGPPVLGYALRRVADPQDAADICAETFTTAWRRIDEVPSGDGELPWLYTVAGYTLNNLRRGIRRQWAVADRLREHIGREYTGTAIAADAATSNPGSGVDRRLDRIGEALAALSPEDRELLQLTLWEELTPAELAQMLGVEAGVVRSRLHRARTRLRAALVAATHDPEGKHHD